MFDFDFIGKYREERKQEYDRLKGGGVYKDVSVGDTVVVAAGLLGRGYIWIRVECEVVQVGDTSCFVKHIGEYELDNWQEWIDRFLIVEVVPLETKKT